ncbi:MAG: hypothetical protein IPL65_15315 [Lewinellaceae bacterium]|nr:hypothetical protein [Lewinellaceae bacterium]
MRTSTSNIYKGEEIRLDFMAPNPGYLGVIDPEGNFFYVVYPSENGFGGLKPFVASEDFKYMWQLNINTQQFKADPYVYGVDENQPVFTKSGNYTFILGDNLHVDDPSMLTKVTVAYHHQLRTDINVVAIP